jgi:heme A synthase
MNRYYPALTVVTVVGTYLLIVVGGVVRVTGSGLGCPDWPTCHGQLVPPLEPTAILEYSHRLLGALMSPLILATALGAWLLRRGQRGVLVPATLAPVLLAVQIVLGAIVVRLELPTMVVLVHLTFALIILGLLVWAAVGAGPAPRARGAGPLQPPQFWGGEAGRRRRRFVGLVHATTTLLFVLLVVGAYVRATGAGYACVGFPDCNGHLLPFGSGPLVDVHLLHRLLAYAVAGLVAVVLVQAWRSWRWLPAIPLTATALAALVVVQIAIGAIAVSTGLPVLVRGLHVAGAAAVWACAVTLAALLTRTRALGTAAVEASSAQPAGAGIGRPAEALLRAERQGQGSAP